MTKADETQVPIHYQSGYLHWNLVIAVGMDYLAGNATKYISRWRKKGGLKDLQKALHYINKLIEVTDGRAPVERADWQRQLILDEVQKFSRANELWEFEQLAIEDLALWRDEICLLWARDTVLKLMDEADPKPVPCEDSNKHADRA